MLDLKEISYQPQTGERKIIDNLNLKVHENEIILICGNSGSGKTTLLEIISGLINPCLLYTSPSPRDISGSRMPSSA